MDDEEYVGFEHGRGREFVQTTAYREVDPREVAHELLRRNHYQDRLPPELEAYREFGDGARFSRWYRERGDQEHGRKGNKITPVWDRDKLTLTIENIVCVEFRRGKGNEQIVVLDAFEQHGRPKQVMDPFADKDKLSQVCKSFNKTSQKHPSRQETGRVFRLSPGQTKVAWRWDSLAR